MSKYGKQAQTWKSTHCAVRGPGKPFLCKLPCTKPTDGGLLLNHKITELLGWTIYSIFAASGTQVIEDIYKLPFPLWSNEFTRW